MKTIAGGITGNTVMTVKGERKKKKKGKENNRNDNQKDKPISKMLGKAEQEKAVWCKHNLGVFLKFIGEFNDYSLHSNLQK